MSLEHSANIEDLSSAKINGIAYVSLEEIKDIQGNPLHILWVSNGTLRISLIMERGFDVGEVFCREEKISWVRGKERCLSDISVDLNQENGWEKGFFAAVTTLGPQLFGTPDEIRTVHGTGAYSPFDLESLVIIYDKKEISVSAEGFSKGFRGEVEYKKKVTMRTRMNSMVFLREETTTNLTDRTLPIDDGYHIQLAGDFMAEGGSYVLPVATDQMLLRDSVPKEVSPKEIYDFNTELDPIRCYQYVPERVTGVEGIGDFKEYKQIQENKDNLTCEMLVNKKGNKAVVVVRPLDVFPRSLLAKRNIAGDDAMYAIEVCKTRPNSIRQKAIDGELMYLEAHASMQSMVAIGILKEELIREMVTCIETRHPRE
ncbi:DUF4432 family protein [Roseburia hominis]